MNLIGDSTSQKIDFYQDGNEHLTGIAEPSNPALFSVNLMSNSGNQDECYKDGTDYRYDSRYETNNTEFHMLDSNTGTSIYPRNPIPVNDRIPLNYKPEGYVHILPSENNDWDNILKQIQKKTGVNHPDSKKLLSSPISGMNPMPSQTDYMDSEELNKLLKDYKNDEGKFLAMTAYGAVPLPEQMLQNIPEKFVSKPIVQENDVFVLKQEHHMRVVERDFVQFEHRFVDIPKTLPINKIETIDDVRIVEVPHFKYKPVVEDKIVEIPKGVKYVEVPVEVPLRMPPKIIPVPKPHIVERIIEQTQPVVQEKIVEVPEIVKKKVPKIVTKDIPYIVPRYVEKIIEVPYYPGQQLPESQGVKLTVVPEPPPLPGTHADYLRHRFAEQLHGEPVQEIPYRGYVENDTLYATGDQNTEGVQSFMVSQNIKHIKLPYEACINVSVVPSEQQNNSRTKLQGFSSYENLIDNKLELSPVQPYFPNSNNETE